METNQPRNALRHRELISYLNINYTSQGREKIVLTNYHLRTYLIYFINLYDTLLSQLKQIPWHVKRTR